jgi:NAD-dependent dihydropyrimidine dehydrogenase PreA subunit
MTHILHILDHHVLQPLKEPVPTVTILPLNKCNDQRKQLIVAISCHNCQDCSFVFACEKNAINANDQSTKFESLNAGT